MKIGADLPDYPALYCDGGIIAKPEPPYGGYSPYGGSWAWCLVDATSEGVRVVSWETGLILPRATAMGAAAKLGKLPRFIVVRIWDVDAIECNQAEYMAAARGLATLPEGWRGRICTDSGNTITRLFGRIKGETNIPDAVRQAVATAAGVIAEAQPVHLQGHPTRADLERGWGERHKSRMPVSVWNVWTDASCGAVIAAARLAGLAPLGKARPGDGAVPPLPVIGGGTKAPALAVAAPVVALGAPWWEVMPQAIRWARKSPLQGDYCQDGSHTPTDRADRHGERVCATCCPAGDVIPLEAAKRKRDLHGEA